MSASTDQPAPPGAPDRHLWRPRGAVFLAVSVAALAVGAFAELLLPPHRASALICPRALPVLLAAQAGFLLLLYPLLAARDPGGSLGPGRVLAAGAGEHALWLAASVPLYVVAAWLSDATACDVVRGVLYLAGVAAASWSLAAWAASGRAGALTAVTLVGGAAAVAAPVAWYLLVELADAPPSAGWLPAAAPVTFAFSLAGRSARWLPAPLWAWLLWPAAAVVLALARLTAGGSRGRRPERP